ncbi:XRE family transcriptional regulator [Candidatus Gastranaerophilales bacterium]|nr:MAG: XRE family transcriptional regulator [Candidatus Gastranaerophilales bacterium]
MQIEKKLGSKISYLRKKKKYSQEKLAEKANISEIYIGEIERGDANPTLEKLKLIAAALGVEVSDLFIFSL